MTPWMMRMIESLVAPHAARRALVIALGDGERPPRDIGAAIYVVTGVDGAVRYVGSTCRPNAAAIYDRLSEHVRDPLKRAQWACVVVFPLHANTSAAVVRQYEGTVARWMLPADGKAWPRAG